MDSEGGAGRDVGTEGAVAAPRSRTRLWLILAIVLVAVVLGWVIAAEAGLKQYEHASGSNATGKGCSGIEAENTRPWFDAPDGLPAEIDDVAQAMEALFAQDRWSLRVLGEDLEDGERGRDERVSVDGDVFETAAADGYQGLARPGSDGIARYDDDRFWVPTCVTGYTFDGMFRDPRCIESTTHGDAVRVAWVISAEGGCDGKVLRIGATLEGGKLTGWTTDPGGRARGTFTVLEPQALSWPSPIWIVPSVLAAHG